MSVDIKLTGQKSWRKQWIDLITTELVAYIKRVNKRKNITMTILDYQRIVIYMCGSVGLPLDKYTTNRQMKMRSLVKKNKQQKFPGNPVVRILWFHFQGPGFDPWLGELKSCKRKNKQDIFNLILWISFLGKAKWKCLHH